MGRFATLVSASGTSSEWPVLTPNSPLSDVYAHGHPVVGGPKLDVGAYLEDVTAAEFCKEGGHRALVFYPERIEHLAELGPLQFGNREGIRREPRQDDEVSRQAIPYR